MKFVDKDSIVEVIESEQGDTFCECEDSACTHEYGKRINKDDAIIVTHVPFMYGAKVCPDCRDWHGRFQLPTN